MVQVIVFCAEILDCCQHQFCLTPSSSFEPSFELPFCSAVPWCTCLETCFAVLIDAECLWHFKPHHRLSWTFQTFVCFPCANCKRSAKAPSQWEPHSALGFTASCHSIHATCQNPSMNTSSHLNHFMWLVFVNHCSSSTVEHPCVFVALMNTLVSLFWRCPLACMQVSITTFCKCFTTISFCFFFFITMPTWCVCPSFWSMFTHLWVTDAHKICTIFWCMDHVTTIFKRIFDTQWRNRKKRDCFFVMAMHWFLNGVFETKTKHWQNCICNIAMISKPELKEGSVAKNWFELLKWTSHKGFEKWWHGGTLCFFSQGFLLPWCSC